MIYKFGHQPNLTVLKKFAKVISWNIWQMDGLSYVVPYSSRIKEDLQICLFDFGDEEQEREPIEALIKNWRTGKNIRFKDLKGSNKYMKFDYCIGNPPYMETRETTKDMPVYDKFLDEAYTISDKVELIHPARFLFNAGATSKNWNEKMLNDKHFKIKYYEQNSSKVFPNALITGGVVVSYRDKNKEFQPIETFTPFDELNSILNKLKNKKIISLNTIMYPYSAYTLSENLWKDFPERKKKVEYIAKNRNSLTKEEKQGELSNLRIITTNIFDLLPDLFFDEIPENDIDYCAIVGRKNNRRCQMYIKKRYINVAPNYDKYKVLISIADGAAGQLGKPIPARIIGLPSVIGPKVGYSQTFQSIGNFETKIEADNACKYIKTKFLRSTLGILKITQHYPPEKWKYVPIQNFTDNSDIDWSKSIKEIDQQLYKKYNLSQEEIEFIETHVKEME